MASSRSLQLRENRGGTTTPRTVVVSDLVIAGWTGRNVDALEKHIKELEALGVPRPSTVPCFYRVAASLLTTADEIELLGTESSGEVEFVLYGTADGLLVGVGSDHTDRKVETYSVVVSKQMCPKPVSRDVWRYADVAPHWDKLVLRSFATRGGVRTLYQDGPITAMRTPEDLIARGFAGAKQIPPGFAMYCGTLAVHGKIAAADKLELELHDPVLERTIRHGYAMKSLPIVT